MADFTPSYTTNTGNLKKFLENIPKIGLPNKLTQEHLVKLGYKSSNDRSIITILKFVGFLQSDGSPTEQYKQFRNTEMSGVVMARCLRSSYNDLFSTFPNANEKDDEALINFMRSTSKAKQDTLAYAVRTFKVLCSFADFSNMGDVKTGESPLTLTTSSTNSILKTTNQQGDAPFILNVNVQITLPETKEYEVYEKIFESLRKHLLTKQSESTP